MTKEQGRDELHRAIWQIANDLRGSVDGWDFKAYVFANRQYSSPGGSTDYSTGLCLHKPELDS